MSDQAPDAISAAHLAAVLNQRGVMPTSPVLPALRFGDDDCGGPCDLQLAIHLLINGSAGGTNMIQEVTAALWLLHRVQEQFEGHLRQAQGGTGIFDHLQGPALQRVQEELTTLYRLIDGINDALMQLHGTVTVPAIERRVRHLHLPLDSSMSEQQQLNLRSQLLISDELLEDLAVERQHLEPLLSNHSGHEPPF